MAISKQSTASANRALSKARKAHAGSMLNQTPSKKSSFGKSSTIREAKSGRLDSTEKRSGSPARSVGVGQYVGTEYAPRIRNVVGILGTNTALAEFLEVSRSRITKWLSGSERPSTENAREILDLDHIISRASLVLHEGEIKNWLTSPNPFIPGNATPLSAIRTGHVGDALSAIEAEAEGAYS